MAFSGSTFTKLYNWLTDPQRNEKIFNSRLDDEFGGIATGLTAVAAINIAEVDPRTYGAVGDGIYITGATSITSGTDDLTVTGAAFVLADVGKRIVVPGAGAAGVPLSTTISAYVSATQVTLGANASTTLAAVSTRVLYGTDDGAAIQAAIDALPAKGGTLNISPGIYLTTTQLTIGDGNSTTASSTYGVRIVGKHQPIFSVHTSTLYPDVSGTVLAWAGTHSTSNRLLTVAGPLRGFEVSNLFLDGMELAGNGLALYAASFGQTDNLSLRGFLGAAYYTSAYTSDTHVDDNNTSHITSENLYILIPAVAGAVGMYLDGEAGDGLPGGVGSDVCDTHSCVFTSVRIYHPPGALLTYGLVLRICDTITFNNLLVIANPANTAAVRVMFDYAAAAGGFFPNTIVFNEVDVGFNPGVSTPNQWIESGSPAAGSFNHVINHLGEGNGGTYPTNLSNTLVGLPMKKLVDVNSVGANTEVAGSNWFVAPKQGMWRVNYSIEITTAAASGTVGLEVGWTSPGGAGKGYAADLVDATVNGAHTEGSFPIMLAASAIPVIIVDFVGTPGGAGDPVYNLFMRAEKLD